MVSAAREQLLPEGWAGPGRGNGVTVHFSPEDRPRDAAVLAERVAGYLQSVETKLRETETEHAVQAERLEHQRHAAARLPRVLAVLPGVLQVSAARRGSRAS